MSPITLPERPLTLSKSARLPYLGLFFIGLMMMGFGAGLAYLQLPSLLLDWKISRNPVTVYDGDIQNGRCTTRKGFFTDCSADLSYVVNGVHYTSETSVMFVDIHSGDYMVDLVRSGDDPSLATMSIGIEKLWNRIIVFAVLQGVTTGLGLFSIISALGTRRTNKVLAQPGHMTPVPVVLTEVNEARKKTTFKFADPAGAKPKVRYSAVFPGAERPLILSTPEGQHIAVAVRHEGANVPVLLDSDLMRLDLTDAERKAALAGLEAESA